MKNKHTFITKGCNIFQSSYLIIPRNSFLQTEVNNLKKKLFNE